MIDNIIPYGKQNITEEDIQSVIETLTSEFLTQGPKILEFEKEFAKYVGAKYAVAVANGTAALHLSVLALGIKPGQKVITTPLTFAASANCIEYCGGEVVFADIDCNSYLLDVNTVKAMLKNAPRGTYAGIIPVDFAGHSVNLEEFRKLADEFGLWLLEDACHSPGGSFTNSQGDAQLCGNGKYADLSVFSFHPVKHIASGEGGMVTTDNEELYNSLLRLRSHGIIRDDKEFINSVEFAGGENGVYPAWYMEMQTLGYNYRLTDFQAALGLSQLKRAESGLLKRRYIANKYAEAFRNRPFVKGMSDVVEGHAYHLFILEVEDRLGLYNFLRQNRIFAQIHYIPCHLMPYYRNRGWKEGDNPVAEEYYKNCISLPMFPTLRDDEQLFVIETIEKFYEK